MITLIINSCISVVFEHNSVDLNLSSNLAKHIFQSHKLKLLGVCKSNQLSERPHSSEIKFGPLGAGLLYFPLAYRLSGGIFIADTMQSIILVFVVITYLILGYCADIKGSNNYQDVIHSLCGARAQLACAVCITLYCFGTCITFLIFIGDHWEM
ncbi:hypothetical protein RRG08_006037, partial [Elysia crispata]